MTDPDWRPAPGERVGLERAGRILQRFDPDIRAAGRAAVDVLRQRHPGQKITGRVFRASELAGYLMDDGASRIALAVVWQDDPRSGYPSSHPVVLVWETGELLVVDNRGEVLARSGGGGRGAGAG